MKQLSFCSFGTPQSFSEYAITDVVRVLQHAFLEEGWNVSVLHNTIRTSQKTILFISEPPSVSLLEILYPYRKLLYWLRIWNEPSIKRFRTEYSDDVLALIRECGGCGSLLEEEQLFLIKMP